MAQHMQLSFQDLDVEDMHDQDLQEYMGVTPEDLVEWKVPRDPTVSSNENYVLYTLHDKYKHPHCQFRSSIWIADLGQANSARRLTQGSFNDQSPQFAPGEGSITFLSDRYKTGDSCAIYQLCLNTDGIATSGTPRPLTPPGNQRPIVQYSWSPKGDFLAYIAAEEKTKEQKQREDTLNDAKVYGEDLPFGQLVALDVQANKIKTLVRGQFHVESFVWSSTGKEILYTTTKSLERNSAGHNGISFGRVGVIDGTINAICHFPGLMNGLPVWLDDKIIFRASATPGRWNSAMAIYTLNLSSGEWERLLYGVDNDAALLAPIATGQLAAAVVQQGLYDHVVFLDATASKQMISLDGDYVINAFCLIHDNGVVNATAIMASNCSPWEVFSWTYKEGTKAENLTKLSTHSKGLDEAYSRVVQPFHCKATDGQALDGVFITPSQSSFDEPKATVIDIHGGPYERSSFVFDPTMYFWAPLFVSLGYAVLCPNYRGGSGHGDEFALATLGEMGNKDYQDIVDIVHASIDQGLVAADKIMVAGWSQGGFLSFLSVTRLEFPLKGAISGAGISDWDVLCMSSDAPWSQKELAGTVPWLTHSTDLSARHGSPVWHMVQQKKEHMVPLLLLHGEADIKVPITQTVGFHRGCLEYGWPCQFVAYPREPHIFVERTHALDMLRRVATFTVALLGGDSVL
ncbi:Alpha/Beta hydrolase protein [Lophiotrema nucula]|uniref:Dipeptidyl-peptidase V n=1 Tax=Lophiotrema nucula TaxID=690887 RepID=A0A6A5ZNH2_9PLEO|nr:Alpha/Beta hydrolase protein [Lophiotrema nucula]